MGIKLNTHIKNNCKKIELEYVEKILPRYQIPHGILPSEGFAFCAFAKYFDTNMILESGTGGGQSTSTWTEFFEHTPVITVDTALPNSTVRKLSSFSNLSFKQGDSRSLLPELIQKNSNRRLSIFIDGPKYSSAINLAKECLTYKNVCMVGIHDFPKLRYSKSDIRDELDKLNIIDFYTDDSEFVKTYSYMDSSQNFISQGVEDSYWKPYWRMSKEKGEVGALGSYGYTIAFIFRKPK